MPHTPNKGTADMTDTLDECRTAFEEWYATNAFDYEREPIGGREATMQWKAWQAAWNTRAKPKADVGWRPISSAPNSTNVLVHYKNSLGKNRTVVARFIPKYTEENSDGENCDYHEERDMFYDPEGWYEVIDNWPDYSHVAFNEGEPSHWMPLPPTPPESQTHE